MSYPEKWESKDNSEGMIFQYFNAFAAMRMQQVV
jgi:hypothetical protein